MLIQGVNISPSVKSGATRAVLVGGEWFNLVFCCPAPHSSAASSTTGPDHLKQDKEGSGNDASSWSVDDVIRFVQEADPHTLGPHIELFRKHVSI